MSVPTEEIDLQYLGGVFLGVENQFRDADYTDVMQGFMPVLEAGEAQIFTTGTDPGGNPLKPNAPSTVKRKGHGIILVDESRLSESLMSETGDSIREASHRGLIFGTSVPYSAFNADRPHVGMSEETLEKLLNTVADATVEKLKATV